MCLFSASIKIRALHIAATCISFQDCELPIKRRCKKLWSRAVLKEKPIQQKIQTLEEAANIVNADIYYFKEESFYREKIKFERKFVCGLLPREETNKNLKRQI